MHFPLGKGTGELRKLPMLDIELILTGSFRLSRHVIRDVKTYTKRPSKSLLSRKKSIDFEARPEVNL